MKYKNLFILIITAALGLPISASANDEKEPSVETRIVDRFLQQATSLRQFTGPVSLWTAFFAVSDLGLFHDPEGKSFCDERTVLVNTLGEMVGTNWIPSDRLGYWPGNPAYMVRGPSGSYYGLGLPQDVSAETKTVNLCLLKKTTLQQFTGPVSLWAAVAAGMDDENFHGLGGGERLKRKVLEAVEPGELSDDLGLETLQFAESSLAQLLARLGYDIRFFAIDASGEMRVTGHHIQGLQNQPRTLIRIAKGPEGSYYGLRRDKILSLFFKKARAYGCAFEISYVQ